MISNHLKWNVHIKMCVAAALTPLFFRLHAHFSVIFAFYLFILLTRNQYSVRFFFHITLFCLVPFCMIYD